MTSHKFGGSHTKIKLELVRLYIDFYTRVLKNQPFNLIYIDPFAGSGECEVKTSQQREDKKTIDVFENTEHKPSKTNTTTIDGSAKIALSIDRLFNEYHFIEYDST
ncbi:MAG: three-Cys-motif partner protein TcmP, partial [Gammaproteobacteria bacterium]|nr:three-Cys-motif partner protein TcmP [Gammaproteobacteria bacterium]